MEVWVNHGQSDCKTNANFSFNFIITPTIIEQYNVSKVIALNAVKVWYAYLYHHRFIYIKQET